MKGFERRVALDTLSELAGTLVPNSVPTAKGVGRGQEVDDLRVSVRAAVGFARRLLQVELGEGLVALEGDGEDDGALVAHLVVAVARHGVARREL